ncbi:hypothetical protein EHF33_11550 [Deinococcus psychrotolerans]|uniref:Uncharacterized protein n=1 Tax=Deinococcus psychrotolerans TaxID=2489213 RepID=A0A3G8YD74_9DEIO|nr:hypothetical protein [Deinococcus psychrotolerans]AZI43298.1 hypothetical protein EHF33_11550 [Deinococcus psychrotolerans]
MFGRRVPVKYVLLFSVLLALVCGGTAIYFAQQRSWIATALLGVLAIWFAVDALRAWSWKKK